MDGGEENGEEEEEECCWYLTEVSIRYLVQRDRRIWKEGTTPIFEQKMEEERATGTKPGFERAALSI